MGAVLVHTDGQRLSLNAVTGMGGSPALTVFSDEAMSSPIALPYVFLGDQTFWVEDGDTVFDIDAVDGTPPYDPRRVQVQKDRVQSLSYIVPLTDLLREFRDSLATDLQVLGVGTSSGGAGVWGQVTGTLADQLDLVAALAGKQPKASRLDQVASIVGSDNDVLQINNGTVQNRTPGQVKASLGILVSDVSALQAALDGKLGSSQLGAANGVAPLDANGKVPSANIPSIVPFTSQTHVADSAARLAQTGLTVPQLTIQDDNHNGYVLLALPASTSGNWAQWTAGSVTSVNGLTGTVSLAASDVSAVPTTRTVTAGTGLTGGGALSADRTLTVAYGNTSTTACVGNDTRLSDARTPAAHASTHASGGSDAVTVAQSQVTGLAAALALLAPLLTPVVTVSGTTYTASSADNGKALLCTSGSSTTVTFPVGLPVGFSVLVRRRGGGNVTIAAGSGATLKSPNGARITTVDETATVDVLETNIVNVNGGVAV